MENLLKESSILVFYQSNQLIEKILHLLSQITEVTTDEITNSHTEMQRNINIIML